MAQPTESVALAAVPADFDAADWDRLACAAQALVSIAAAALERAGLEAPGLTVAQVAEEPEELDPAITEGLFSTLNLPGNPAGALTLAGGGGLAGALAGGPGKISPLEELWPALAARLGEELGREIAVQAAPAITGTRAEIVAGLARAFPAGERAIAVRGAVAAAEGSGPFELRVSADWLRLLLVPAARPSETEPRPPAPAPAAEMGSEEPALELGGISDVELELIARFGEIEMKLEDVLALAPGSVIELARSVEDPVDLLVNGKLVGRAEVVVVGEKFGLRVREVHRRRLPREP